MAMSTGLPIWRVMSEFGCRWSPQGAGPGADVVGGSCLELNIGKRVLWKAKVFVSRLL
jgi:hypothetical protein